MPKIAVIGAGSMVFSRALLSDILAFDALKETEFALMDTDAGRLAIARAMAESINATRKAAAKITATDDRRAAIDGADYVINTIGVGGIEATRLDLAIPEKYGVRQVISDTLCMGGIFRTLRSLPIVLEMAAEMEQLCPDALLLTYTNPMATHVLGVARASKVRVVGLCHGVRYTAARMVMLARLAQMPKAEAKEILDARGSAHEPGGTEFSRFFHSCLFEPGYETLSAGINHMAAFLVFRKDGQDQYPWLFKAAEDPDIRNVELVRLELMQRFGFFFTETCGHISEYLPWFNKSDAEIQRLAIRPNAYLLTCADLEKTAAEYRRKAEAGEPFIRPDEPVSVEYASRIVNAVETDTPFVFNGNVHNAGGALISNLPADCCVEVPCVATGVGIRPTRIGELPPQCAAMMRTNVNVQDLLVESVLQRKREHVYHAAMLDPNTAAALTLPEIAAMVDEMIAAYGELMPQYLRA